MVRSRSTGIDEMLGKMYDEPAIKETITSLHEEYGNETASSSTTNPSPSDIRKYEHNVSISPSVSQSDRQNVSQSIYPSARRVNNPAISQSVNASGYPSGNQVISPSLSSCVSPAESQSINPSVRLSDGERLLYLPLTVHQGKVLLFLYEAGNGPTNAKVISEHTGVAFGTVKGALILLVERGYILSKTRYSGHVFKGFRYTLHPTFCAEYAQKIKGAVHSPDSPSVHQSISQVIHRSITESIC